MTNEKKPHPLKGRKKSAESIRKRLETLARKRAARETGEHIPPSRAGVRKKRKGQHVETRSHEQLARDVGEAIWCLQQAVKGTRRAIAAGLVSLTDVSDEETYMYMAMRYLQGGLKP